MRILGLREQGSAFPTAAPTRRWSAEALAVGAGTLAVLWLVRLLEGPHPPLKGDQVLVNLIVIKNLHPEWFQGDLVLGGDYYRYYTPFFVAVQAALARLWGDDPVAALHALFWPVGLIFLVGHYVLFRFLTGSPAMAALGSLSAMTVRNALGGEYWGFAGVSTVQPRTIAAGLIPLLLVVFLRGRTHPLFPGFFLLAGGMANLHPVSALHFAQVTAGTHLWLARFRWRAWREVVTGVGLFALGALPFIIPYLSGKENLTDQSLFPTVREALHYRYGYLLFPLKADALLSVAFHVALPIVVLLWLRRRGSWTDELRTLLLLGALALLMGFGGTAASQVFGVLADQPYPDIMQLRATKLMYVPLLAALPLAFRELLSRRRSSARVGLMLLFACSLIPPGLLIHSFPRERRDSVKEFLRIAVKPRPVPVVRSRESAMAQEALWQWVVEKTGRNDLFFSDSLIFRAKTLRPITGAFKDAYTVLAGTAPMYRWYVYIREVRSCRVREGTDCWFGLARKYSAKYVVVDPGVSRAVPGKDFVRVWAQSGWSLWRRVEGE